MKNWQLVTVFAFLGSMPFALAQAPNPTKDVCCLGYTEAEGDITAFTTPMSDSSCRAGSKDNSGRNLCGSTNNLDECAYMKPEAVCSRCGLHWLKEVGKCSKKSLEELVPKKEEAPKVEKKK